MRQILPALGRLLLLPLLLTISCVVFSQHVLVDSFPITNQFYPRDLVSNKGRVVVEGTLVDPAFDGVKLTIYRDFNRNGSYSDPNEMLRDTVLPLNASNKFKYVFEQDAELYNYLYLLRGRRVGGTNFFDFLKSTQGVTLNIAGVVVGDAVIINGQSNGAASKRPLAVGISDSATVLENFIRVYESGDEDSPISGANTWSIGRGDVVYNQSGNIGQWGKVLGMNIIRNFNVPVCILNGSHFATPIEYYQRNDNNPVDQSTNYGRLLSRVKRAGLDKKIRAIFWYQGENDAYDDFSYMFPPGFHLKLNTSQYKSEFNKLFNDWKEDYGNFERLYIFQIRNGCFSTRDDALQIQQAQYELANELPNASLISTNNLPQLEENITNGPIGESGNSYCHFDYLNGYKDLGQRAFDLVRQHLYGSTTNIDNTTTPVPLSAEFSAISLVTPGLASEITLRLKNSSDTYTLTSPENNVLSDFRLLGGNYSLTGISITGNLVKINFVPVGGTTTNPTGLTFYSHKGTSAAPAIVNAKGIGMASFSNLTIGFGVLPADPLSLRINQNGSANDISWDVDGNQDFDSFIIERSETGANFTEIASVQCNGRPGKVSYRYLDSKPNSLKNYYRIHAIRTNGNGLYSQVVVVNNKLNTVPGITIFPNPATERANVRLTLRNAGEGSITLFDLSGKTLSTRKLQFQKGTNTFSVGELLDHGAGVYIIKVQTATEVYQTKVIRMK